MRLSFILFFIPCLLFAQPKTKYIISFDQAVHHIANIEAHFYPNTHGDFLLRMSRSSPGRYAIHEFAKNVHQVQAFDQNGKPLRIERPDPYSWKIKNQKGQVKIKYALFANRGDGTYSQINNSHAHLNMPATFMYAPSLENHPMEVSFIPRTDLGWKIATQLPKVKGKTITYYAPNLQYFMDSPTELSNHHVRSFEVASNGKSYQIKFVLHDPDASDAHFDTFFEKVKKVVLAQKEVFGELPDFDYGTYQFLACYTPNASGDGMEHRNSTILTTTRSLAANGIEQNIGTVSHEFFHAWNVERLRPQNLEPFDFEKANMSDALWFAEGFTSYYTNLILCRAGILDPDRYIAQLSGALNYVWNSPSLEYRNPIQMSQLAPFKDAAVYIDQANWNNSFVSYYSYGSVLGLALDLMLREKNLSLDGYMKELWNSYGKTEKPYKLQNLQNTLENYAGKTFGTQFFKNYIYDSKMPNYKHLFALHGVDFHQPHANIAFVGGTIENNIVTQAPLSNQALYKAGITKGDQIIKLGNASLSNDQNFGSILLRYQPGENIPIVYRRNGEQFQTKIRIQGNPKYQTHKAKDASPAAITKQQAWLQL
ncbi:MAG: peptidase M61 [Flavobacteriaceae bacterium]|nr:peptidase M61 [Flavobacteriaceae bacterium]